MPATKVRGFPQRTAARRIPRPTKYPWHEIAEDRGVWAIDPADYEAKPASVQNAALAWGNHNGYKTHTALRNGTVYVQFRKQGRKSHR